MPPKTCYQFIGATLVRWAKCASVPEGF
jgi:hypothetical protein